MPIPSIVSSNDALRQRRQLEDELRVAATVARARQHWATQWKMDQIPIPVAATHASALSTSLSLPMPPRTSPPVAATYRPVFDETFWGTLTIGGLRRDKLVGYSHMAAFVLHLVRLPFALFTHTHAHAHTHAHTHALAWGAGLLRHHYNRERGQ